MLYTSSELTENTFHKSSHCHACGNGCKHLFDKAGANGHVYSVFECSGCGLWQLDPQPSVENLNALYRGEYFTERSDRGYNGYTSDPVKKSILTTLEKNLNDIGFFEWEKSLGTHRKLLDVGCSAGHAVEWFNGHGWCGEGIDIAPAMIEAGRSRGLKLNEGDFLTFPYKDDQFDLITLWASIEHLPNPGAFLKRIAKLLKPGGKLYISTCHLGFFARLHGAQWRFMNVPEHLFFFTRKSLQDWGSRYNLVLTKSFTYGSGMTSKQDPDLFHKAAKPLLDQVARHFHLGDMIVAEFTLS